MSDNKLNEVFSQKYKTFFRYYVNIKNVYTQKVLNARVHTHTFAKKLFKKYFLSF